MNIFPTRFNCQPHRDSLYQSVHEARSRFARYSSFPIKIGDLRVEDNSGRRSTIQMCMKGRRISIVNFYCNSKYCCRFKRYTVKYMKCDLKFIFWNNLLLYISVFASFIIINIYYRIYFLYLFPSLKLALQRWKIYQHSLYAKTFSIFNQW